MSTCPECGAPVDAAGVADAEAAVYPQLARANLARMRGDYKQAEDELLSVLRRYPNNPSANEMLGDLAAEREDYQHAMQWYELALEIVPESASIARKVREARGHLTQKEAQDTTAQLNLPDNTSRTPIVVGALIVVVVAVAIGAYMLGAKNPPRAGPTQMNVIRAEQSTPDVAPTTSPSIPPSASTKVQEDQDLFTALKGKTGDANALIGVTHDPRAGNVTITFALPGEDYKALAVRLAKDGFAALPGYSNLTLRGVMDGKIVYMADATRDRATEVETPAWKEQHGDDPATVAAYLLQNEWPAATAAPPGSGSPSTSTAGDSSATNTTGGPGTPTTGQ